MSGIFISYRRADSGYVAAAVYRALKGADPDREVFMDVGIAPGEDFQEAIDRALAGARLVFALVGPDWLGLDESGRSRLHDEDDVLRLELATALKLGCKVVPVLLDNARMPTLEELPDDIKDLKRRQAIKLRAGDFESDLRNLVRVAGGGSRWRRMGAYLGAAGAVMAATVAIFLLATGDKQPPPRNDPPPKRREQDADRHPAPDTPPKPPDEVENAPAAELLLRGRFLNDGLWNGGERLEVEGDVDADGIEETIAVEVGHPNGTAMKLYDGESGTEFGTDVADGNRGFDEFGNLREDWHIHLAVKDVTNDGKPEILVAAGDGLTESRLTILQYAGKTNDPHARVQYPVLKRIGALDGQAEFRIQEAGFIEAPYGSQGLYTVYRWDGSAFAEVAP